MNLDELIDVLHKKNIRISLDGDNLRVHPNENGEKLDSKIYEAIKANKSELVSLLKEKMKESKHVIPQASLSDTYPVSFSQERIWVLSQFSEYTSQYYMHGTFLLKGEINPNLLVNSFKDVVERHSSLRTTFRKSESSLVQVIHAHMHVPVTIHTTSNMVEGDFIDACKEKISSLLKVPFDLEHGPLLKIDLFENSKTEYVLFVKMHHIISDRWSVGVFLDEISKIYNSAVIGNICTLSRSSIKYHDYAVWQRDRLIESAYSESLDFWSRELSGAPQKIKFQSDDRLNNALSGGMKKLDFDMKISKSIFEYCINMKISKFTFFLGVLKLVLYKWTAQRDLVVGTVVSGRDNADTQDVIGCFMNFLSIRSRISNDENINSFLSSLNINIANCFSHQECPFDLVVNRINPSRTDGKNPIFNVALLLQNIELPNLQLNGIDCSVIDREHETSLLDLRFIIEQNVDVFAIRCEYRTDVFQSAEIDELLFYYSNMMRIVIKQSQLPISELGAPEKLLGLRAYKDVNNSEINNKVIVSSNFNSEMLAVSFGYFRDKLNENIFIDFLPYNQVIQQINDIKNYNHKNIFHVILLRWQDICNNDKNFYQNAAFYFDGFKDSLLKASNNYNCTFIVALFSATDALAEISEICSSFNDNLKISFSDSKNVFIYDADQSFENLEQDNIFDPLANEIGRVPYSFDAFIALGVSLFRIVHSHIRRPFKVLVLDCDNTLWGGICGEDGVDGISLSKEHIVFQNFLKQQKNHGFLLCLNSKNNFDDVAEVFSKKEGMVLSLDDFSSLQINWNQKSQNIKNIAIALNLNLNSFVFIDDDYVQCLEVRQNCPEVITYHMPRVASEIPSFMSHIWAIDSSSKQKNTLDRTELYKQNEKRNFLKESVGDTTEFIKNLNISTEYACYSILYEDRVLELLERTNQFNLSLQKYSAKALNDSNKEGLVSSFIVKVSDRFGDYGIVGFVLYETNAQDITVTDFLLSCRVLGRGVEHQIVNKLGAIAELKGKEFVRFKFNKNKRNVPIIDFLKQFDSVKDDFDSDKGFTIITTSFAKKLSVKKSNDVKIKKLNILSNADSYDYSEFNHRFYEKIPYIASDITSIKSELEKSSLAGERPSYDPPITDSEHWLAEVWSQFISVSLIGRSDNFFHLGGNSLLATSVMSRIEKRLKRKLGLRPIFNSPMLWQLAEWMDSFTVMDNSVDSENFLSTPHDGIDLSFQQEQIWLDILLNKTGKSMNHPSIFSINGIEDVSWVNEIFQEIVRRHSVFSYRYSIAAGKLSSHRSDNNNFSVLFSDVLSVDGALDLYNKEKEYEFSIESDCLIRVNFLTLSEKKHFLIVNLHHLVTDGWSMTVMFKEFIKLYELKVKKQSFDILLKPVPYDEFVLWQKNSLSSIDVKNQRKYWLKTLSNINNKINWPFDNSFEYKDSKDSNRIYFRLPDSLAASLSELSKKENCTLYTLLFSALNVLLHVVSSSTDIRIATTTANRRSHRFEETIGCFLNTLVIRSNVNSDMSFRRVINEIKENIMSAFDNQDVPLQQIVKDLGFNRRSDSHLYQVLFTLHNYQSLDVLTDVLDINLLDSHVGYTKTDLTLVMTDINSQLEGYFEYCINIFPQVFIDSLINQFINLLQTLSADIEMDIKKYIIDSADNKENIDFSNIFITDLLEWHCKEFPNKVAVTYSDETLSYNELLDRSNAIALYLDEMGIGVGALVGVCIHRSIDTLPLLIGIMKAGAAYLPIDPAYPIERINYIVDDSKLSLLFLSDLLRDKLSSVAIKKECIGDLSLKLLNNNNIAKKIINKKIIDPENLAYVIYTSGTTGFPKGVSVTRKGLSNYLSWAGIYLKEHTISGNSIVHSSLSFDATITSLFSPLLFGGTVKILPEQDELMHLSDELKSDNNIGLVKITPAHMSALSTAFGNDVFTNKDLCFVIGGEALTTALAFRWKNIFPFASFINEYGPTETVVGCSTFNIAEFNGETHELPIGKPIPDMHVHVCLDPYTKANTGDIGEIYISGPGLARGYLNKPGLTAEKYLPNPFSLESGERIYKTGDLGMIDDAGVIHFLGRSDRQVKIRGYRIELSELEIAATTSIYVDTCVAMVIGEGDAKSLALFVVSTNPGLEEIFIRNDINEACSTLLPVYMRPSIIHVVESMPLTINGKIDKKALESFLVIDALQPESMVFTAPTTSTEIKLHQMWSDLFKIEQVSIDSNFISLGGHSVLAVQHMYELNRHFKIDLPISQVFETSTIRLLAKCIDNACNQGGADVIYPEIIEDRENSHEPFALTEIQEAYYIGRLDVFGSGNISTSFYCELNFAELDYERFCSALNELISRHASLRSIFPSGSSQIVLERVPLYRVDFRDLSNLSDAQQSVEIENMRQQMSTQILPADKWPLFDVKVTKLSESSFRWHLNMDVMITDAASLQILKNDFHSLYFGKNDLPKINVSYRDYVVAKQKIKESSIYNNSKNYWKNRIATLPLAPQIPVLNMGKNEGSQIFSRRQHILPDAQWSKIKELCKARSITPSSLLIAAFSSVLERWASSNSFTLNLTLFDRLPLHKDINKVVGDFTSLTLLEINLDHKKSLLENAVKIQNQLFQDLENRFYSGVDVLRDMNSLYGNSLDVIMPVVFTSALGIRDSNETGKNNSTAADQRPWGDIGYAITRTSQVWLDHVVSEEDGALRIIWDCVDALFPHHLLDNMFSANLAILSSLAQDNMLLDRAAIISLPEKEINNNLLDGQSTLYLSKNSLGKIVKDTVKLYGEKHALCCEELAFTYFQLDKKANHVAHLIDQHLQSDHANIAIFMDKSALQVLSVLGVAYSGHTYVPIDVDTPISRIESILQQANIQLILADSQNAKKIYQLNVQHLALSIEMLKEHDYLGKVCCPNDVAYIIFTSGSTGEPKGVAISHSSALNTIVDVNHRFGVSDSDRIFGISSLNFDLSVWDIFGSFAAGATLVLPQEGLKNDLSYWFRIIQDYKITIWNSVPALANLFVEKYIDFISMETVKHFPRLFLLSGDWIPLSLPVQIKSLRPDTKVISLGGATEVSIWSVFYEIKEINESWLSIPYGKALTNQYLLVLDEHMRHRPNWVVGNIYIGGYGLSSGYIHNVAETQRRFVTLPDTGEVLYDTGDLGRYWPDGNIEFLGRADSQVKINGHRIELGEIENALNALECIDSSVVLSIGESEKRLIAFVIGHKSYPHRSSKHNSSSADKYLVGNDQQSIGFDEVLEIKLSQPGVRQFGLDANVITLPSAPLQAISLSPIDVLPKHLYGRHIESPSLPFDFLSSWLSSLAQNAIEGELFPKYYYPSAGSLYLVQTYLYIPGNFFVGIDAGYYFYNTAYHELVKETGVSSLDVSKKFVEVHFVVNPEKMNLIYGDLSNKFCTIESGHVEFLLKASASALGLSIVEGDKVNQEQLRNSCGINENQLILNSFFVGKNQEKNNVKDSISLSLMERQSYREFLNEPIKISNVELILSKVNEFYKPGFISAPRIIISLFSNDHNSPSSAVLYEYILQDNSFHMIKDFSVEIKVEDEIRVKNIFPNASFSIFFVAENKVENHLCVGNIAQAIMSLCAKLHMGVCPLGAVGSLTGGDIFNDNQSILYSLVGGAISDEQINNWHHQLFNENDVSEAINEELSSQLPQYMLPNKYIWLDQFPLSANGKVDRKALSQLEFERELVEAIKLPENELEVQFAKMWSHILGVDKIGINQNFFEAGGSSIGLVKMKDYLNTNMNLDVSLVDLFKYPSIEKLMQYLAGNNKLHDSKEKVMARAEKRKLSMKNRKSKNIERKAANVTRI